MTPFFPVNNLIIDERLIFHLLASYKSKQTGENVLAKILQPKYTEISFYTLMFAASVTEEKVVS